jgi:hypothetical protein
LHIRLVAFGVGRISKKLAAIGQNERVRKVGGEYRHERTVILGCCRNGRSGGAERGQEEKEKLAHNHSIASCRDIGRATGSAPPETG